MSNPFKLEIPTLICFSTGRTSAFMLYKIIEAYGGVQENGRVDGSVLPEGIVVSFQNTGAERTESLQFGHEIETEWSVDLNWLEWYDEFNPQNYVTLKGEISLRRKNYGPWEGFRQKTFETASKNREPYWGMIEYYNQYRVLVGKPPILPNPTARMCTAQLKMHTSERYMKSLGYPEFDCVLGIRRDEPKRFTKMMAENDRASNPYFNVCPLYEADISKPEIMKFWGYDYLGVDKDNVPIWQPNGNCVPGFDLQLDPNSDEGNCDLCFLKNVKKIITIMRKTNEYDGFWVGAEEMTGQRFRKDRPSYLELRQMIDRDDPKLDLIMAKAKGEKTIDCICGEAS